MGSEGLQELYDYEESLKVYRDWYSIISTAKKKGREEGEKAGEKKKQQEIALKMKVKGFSTAEIAEVTGLSPDHDKRIQTVVCLSLADEIQVL